MRSRDRGMTPYPGVEPGYSSCSEGAADAPNVATASLTLTEGQVCVRQAREKSKFKSQIADLKIEM